MEDLSPEESRIISKIKQRVHKTIKSYGLIDDGDHILIGLSGGKDSLALVEFLGEKMKIYKPKFSLIAAHISIKHIPYRTDLDYLQKFCAAYSIPFVHHVASFTNSTDTRNTPCFLCSWYRRKALFELAKTHNCGKIALGHHQDDVIETLLLNMTFQGSFGTMPPLLSMDKFEMKIIRPLSMNKESEIKQLAEIRKYVVQKKNCPHEKDSHRHEMKQLLSTLEKMNPDFRGSMWNAMTNIQENYLPKQTKS